MSSNGRETYRLVPHSGIQFIITHLYAYQLFLHIIQLVV